MDLLNKSSRYQKYLDRINQYKEIVDENQAFSSIQERINTLSLDLKSKNDKNYYNYLHLAIIAIGLMVGTICVLDGHYFIAILLITATVVSKYLFNSTMKARIEDTEKEQVLEQNEQAFDVQLFHRMQYLKNGIELKYSRISMVRYTFMAIFPLLLISSMALFSISVEVSMFVKSILAVMMGCIFWFYFFKDDLDELDYQEMELQEYINDFLSTSPKASEILDDPMVVNHVTDLEQEEQPKLKSDESSQVQGELDIRLEV